MCPYWLQDGVTRSRARPSTRSLPDWALAPDAAVFLNIPMDAETPRCSQMLEYALLCCSQYIIDLTAAWPPNGQRGSY